MTFERKIAGQGLADVKAPTIAPTDEQRSGALRITGGGPIAPDRGHKNWGQTINHQFELRSLMGTAWFKNLATTPGSYALDLGAFGYHTVRSAGPTLAVSLLKPDGVPTSQHNKDGGFRHRQRWGWLEVYYPEDTTLSFSADFAFTTVAWKAELWEQEDLALLVGGDEPITYAMLARGVVPQRLDELLAEGPRLAGTSDLFLISYNERTGKATVVLLSGPAGMEGMDPEVPDPDATEPVGEPSTPTPPPWEKPKLAPGSLDPDTQHDYTDPVTGLPLVPTPPPAAAGTLYALHGASVSVSDNGGASWAPVNITGAGTLVDIVATPAGLFVLDSAGQVFTAQDISQPFQLVQIADTSTAEVEIPLVNGNFETGDLAGWTSLGIDTPRVLRTAQPPQLPGSTYYLTRDWRIINPQPFAIQQLVTLPESMLDDAVPLRATVDVLCESGDTGRIQILDGTETVVANDNFAIIRTDSNFRADGFAASPTQGPLNLVGTGTPLVGSFINESLPIWLRGSSGQAVSGSIAWRIEKADGSLYDGRVTLRVYDVDGPETLTISGVEDYDLLASTVNATTVGFKKILFAGRIDDGTTADLPGVRIHVTVGPEFSFDMTGVTQSAFGLKGPGAGAAPAPTELAAANSSSDVWEELTAEWIGPKPSKVLIRISGMAVTGNADVYFDNVRLSGTQEAAAPVVLAIASVEGDAGGAELYLDGGILRYVADPAERGATVEVPAADISMADHAPNGVRVASNVAQAWAWAEGSWGDAIDGPFTSALADPVPMLVKADGAVLNGLGGVLATLGAGTWHASGDRRRDGGLMTDAPTGVVKSVANGGVVTTGTTQPVSTEAVARRSLATDSGRIFGWSVGSTDLLWTSDLGASWKVAGALGAPIIKIVEMR